MEKKRINNIGKTVKKVVKNYIDRNCFKPEKESLNTLPSWSVLYELRFNNMQPQIKVMTGVYADSPENAEFEVISWYRTMIHYFGDNVDFQIKTLRVDLE